MEFKDYYKTLGVERNATEDDIRKAFRKLARQYHPDVAKDKSTAETRFKEINEAYEVLGDVEKRRQYDDLGSAWQQGAVPPQWRGRRAAGAGAGQSPYGDFEFGGTGFSDFFEMFFGGQRRRSRPGGNVGGFEWGMDREDPATVDTEADLMVPLEEAVLGGMRKITVRRAGGSGAAQQTYDVRIPAGVYDGQRIRLAGQGEPSTGSSQRGDLYLRVKLARHPDFRIEPNGDLYADISLPAWRAVLGGETTVPTLGGHAKLKVPAGTQHGQKFRLRGQGAPVRGGGRGDLYAVAQIEVPREVTERQRELWRQLAAEEEGVA